MCKENAFFTNAKLRCKDRHSKTFILVQDNLKPKLNSCCTGIIFILKRNVALFQSKPCNFVFYSVCGTTRSRILIDLLCKNACDIEKEKGKQVI